MPRGVKKSADTIEEQITQIEEKINAHKAKISSLSAKKKALQNSREKAEINSLYQIIKKSGKAPSEFISELTQNQH